MYAIAHVEFIQKVRYFRAQRTRLRRLADLPYERTFVLFGF